MMIIPSTAVVHGWTKNDDGNVNLVYYEDYCLQHILIDADGVSD